MRETAAHLLKALRAIFGADSTGTAGRDLLASTQPSSFRPPDMSGVAERAPAMDPALLAHYWREALAYLDFRALALTGKRKIKPLGIHTVEETGRMAGLQVSDTEAVVAPDAQQEVDVVLGLWEVDRKGSLQVGKQRHPLFSVPAWMDKEGCLVPRGNRMPEWNARYLAPDNQPGCFALAREGAANTSRLAARRIRASPRGASAGRPGAPSTTPTGTACSCT